VESGEYDAIVISKAGLDRLGWSQKITEPISTDISLPAVGQGAIAIQSRVSDRGADEFLSKLDDMETRTAIIAERALLSALQGGCQVPIGAWARVERGELVMEAVGVPSTARSTVREKATAPPDQATAWGTSRARARGRRRANDSGRGASHPWLKGIISRLRGNAFVVTRALEQGQSLVDALREAGAEPFLLPLVAFAPQTISLNSMPALGIRHGSTGCFSPVKTHYARCSNGALRWNSFSQRFLKM